MNVTDVTAYQAATICVKNASIGSFKPHQYRNQHRASANIFNRSTASIQSSTDTFSTSHKYKMNSSMYQSARLRAASLPLKLASVQNDAPYVLREQAHPEHIPESVPSTASSTRRFHPSQLASNYIHPPAPVHSRPSHLKHTPQMNKLSEFVARMVFVIFWGGDTFDEIFEAIKSEAKNPFASEDGGPPDVDSIHRMRQMFHRLASISLSAPLNSTHIHRDPLHATPEFIEYTKFILYSMQISCSTALLSLFYLHRLRPCVQHLFVDGTFDAQAGLDTSPSSSPPSYQKRQRPQTQYRRDSKLEYRLFTVSLIIANKFLDDNSFSNRAWSDITGLDLRKINIMESEFMKYIDFSLVVVETEYVAWVNWLELYIGSVMATSTTSFSHHPHLSHPSTSSHSSQNTARRFSLPQASSTSLYGERRTLWQPLNAKTVVPFHELSHSEKRRQMQPRTYRTHASPTLPMSSETMSYMPTPSSVLNLSPCTQPSPCILPHRDHYDPHHVPAKLLHFRVNSHDSNNDEFAFIHQDLTPSILDASSTCRMLSDSFPVQHQSTIHHCAPQP